jgi:hypothetical protein
MVVTTQPGVKEEAQVQIEIDTKLKIELDTSSLSEILKKFSQILLEILSQFVATVLLSFADHHLAKGDLFNCKECGSNNRLHWKTKHGKVTGILTPFGKISLPQLQLQCACGHRFVITRKLLCIEPRCSTPSITVRMLGFIGSLTSFRVAEKITRLFGVKLNRMAVWRCVQRLGETIHFDLDPAECKVGEADGTGIPIQGIAKRGRELKVFVQLKKSGGCRIAGLSIGKYDSQWDKLFKPLKESLALFSNFQLITDGDASILKGLGKKLTIIYQRCLWHIPHQFKFTLWKDKVVRKSQKWTETLARLIDIVNVKSILAEDQDKIVALLIAAKKQKLQELIAYCESEGWKSSTSYLRNAQNDIFTGVEKRLAGKTTSHVERVMRTVNLRVNVGKWSPGGALNACKIRLAHYYNGWDV